MLKKLYVKNIVLEDQSLPLSQVENRGVFILKTCQRNLLISYNCSNLLPEFDAVEEYYGTQAYHYLLRVLCGLESRLTGETEIVSQVKKAYQEYLINPNRDPKVLTILEKLFKDGKDVRHRYLHKIGQYSYAGLSKKALVNAGAQDQKVLILGSGSLANDLIKVLNKRFRLCLLARNRDKVIELQQKYEIEGLNWEKTSNIEQYPFVINTIEALTPFTNKIQIHRRMQSSQGLFIDLSNKLCRNFPGQKPANILGLHDLFNQAKEFEWKKKRQVQAAHKYIDQVVVKRSKHLSTPVGGKDVENSSHRNERFVIGQNSKPTSPSST